MNCQAYIKENTGFRYILYLVRKKKNYYYN